MEYLFIYRRNKTNALLGACDPSIQIRIWNHVSKHTIQILFRVSVSAGCVSEIIFTEDSQITNAFVDHEYAIGNYREFIEEVRKDVLSLGYNELYSQDTRGDETIYSIRLQYNTEAEHLPEGEAIVNYNYLSINKRYVNAIKWLDENGYSKYKRASSTEIYVD